MGFYTDAPWLAIHWKYVRLGNRRCFTICWASARWEWLPNIHFGDFTCWLRWLCFSVEWYPRIPQTNCTSGGDAP